MQKFIQTSLALVKILCFLCIFKSGALLAEEGFPADTAGGPAAAGGAVVPAEGGGGGGGGGGQSTPQPPGNPPPPPKTVATGTQPAKSLQQAVGGQNAAYSQMMAPGTSALDPSTRQMMSTATANTQGQATKLRDYSQDQGENEQGTQEVGQWASLGLIRPPPAPTSASQSTTRNSGTGSNSVSSASPDTNSAAQSSPGTTSFDTYLTPNASSSSTPLGLVPASVPGSGKLLLYPGALSNGDNTSANSEGNPLFPLGESQFDGFKRSLDDSIFSPKNDLLSSVNGKDLMRNAQIVSTKGAAGQSIYVDESATASTANVGSNKKTGRNNKAARTSASSEPNDSGTVDISIHTKNPGDKNPPGLNQPPTTPNDKGHHFPFPLGQKPDLTSLRKIMDGTLPPLAAAEEFSNDNPWTSIVTGLCFLVLVLFACFRLFVKTPEKKRRKNSFEKKSKQEKITAIPKAVEPENLPRSEPTSALPSGSTGTFNSFTVNSRDILKQNNHSKLHRGNVDVRKKRP
jgi:hypothetical protein